MAPPARRASLSRLVVETRPVRVAPICPAGSSKKARLSTMSDWAEVVTDLVRSV